MLKIVTDEVDRDDLPAMLDELVAAGALRMLMAGLETGVADHIARHQQMVDGDGLRLVVRNGRAAERTLVTGAGALKVRAPRVDDRREGHRFSSYILPRYARRSPKYPKAVAKLVKDRDVLLTFYDFPASHWIHLRTTNPIESTFATVRARTRVTKGAGTRRRGLVLAYKLLGAAQDRWRKVKSPNSSPSSAPAPSSKTESSPKGTPTNQATPPEHPTAIHKIRRYLHIPPFLLAFGSPGSRQRRKHGRYATVRTRRGEHAVGRRLLPQAGGLGRRVRRCSPLGRARRI